MRRAALLICSALVLTGCATPHQRGHVTLSKQAARGSEVTAVLERYREVRNTAISLLDPKPLSTVESGSVLNIDSGSFQVSQLLAQKQKQDTSQVDLTSILTPRFTAYPLWFVVETRDTALKVNRIQVFQRDSAVDPWLLVASPETVSTTSLPGLRSVDGSVVTVKPGDGVGMSMSPQAAAASYAKALADPKSTDAGNVVADSFVKQMRSAEAKNSALKGVTFSQAWATEKVHYALRTSDGGALAFVTLTRRDTYKVKSGLTITWPKGTPQEAFLAAGISGSGTLNYDHQVLLYIPGDGGKPRAIGQYGGVIGADGN
ncbi:MAG: hypothetical protein JWQ70_173 [Aeromicrobium sp.]|nr:hypothetical protein [Aeromicrobium sp.]